MVDEVAGSAYAAARVFRDVDLEQVDPDVSPELRGRLAAAVAMYDRLLRAVADVAAEAARKSPRP